MQLNTNQFLVRFNQSIDHWIDELEAYTIDILRQKPNPDTWSLGQVYVHIADDTRWFAAQIKLASESNDNSHEPMKGKGRWLFDNDGFPDMIIVGPSVNDSVPQPASKEILRQQLQHIRDEVNQLCTAIDIEQATGKTQHPGLGYFSALEWLRYWNVALALIKKLSEACNNS